MTKIQKYVDEDGTIEWCNENWLFHREGGAAVIKADCTQEWWINGKLHRKDGPAVITSYGRQEWWFEDKLHRENGPAVIHADGTKEWWFGGKNISVPDDWKDKDQLTPEEQVLFKLMFSTSYDD